MSIEQESHLAFQELHQVQNESHEREALIQQLRQQIESLTSENKQLKIENQKFHDFYQKEPMRLQLIVAEWIKSHVHITGETQEEHQARKARAMATMETAINHKCMEVEQLEKALGEISREMRFYRDRDLIGIEFSEVEAADAPALDSYLKEQKQ